MEKRVECRGRTQFGYFFFKTNNNTFEVVCPYQAPIIYPLLVRL